MRNYWSCSKLADKIRGTTKPEWTTVEEWPVWEDNAKKAHPFRYWLAEEALDSIEDAIHWPADKLNNIRYWLNNRFVTRTHQLTSRLKPGEWHEFDTRILHCLFDELVNFVEIEKAWMQVCWGDADVRKKYQLPFWRKHNLLRWFRQWRCPEAGVDHLKWEITLTNVDYVEPDHPDYGKPTHQALKAREILDLYNWWKFERPARPDPYEASGWMDYCERSRIENNGHFMPTSSQESPELKKLGQRAHKLLDKMEKAYEKEDDEKLLQLIKLRRGLWT